jgi:hypothetical protein
VGVRDLLSCHQHFTSLIRQSADCELAELLGRSVNQKKPQKGAPMDTKTDRAIADATGEVSLVRGGPSYKAQQALGLIRFNEWNLGRRIMMLTAVTWLPLVLLTALLNPVG